MREYSGESVERTAMSVCVFVLFLLAQYVTQTCLWPKHELGGRTRAAATKQTHSK